MTSREARRLYNLPDEPDGTIEQPARAKRSMTRDECIPVGRRLIGAVTIWPERQVTLSLGVGDRAVELNDRTVEPPTPSIRPASSAG